MLKLLVYTLLSLAVAFIAYFALGSVGSFESRGINVSGGIVFYFLNMLALSKLDKIFFIP